MANPSRSLLHRRRSGERCGGEFNCCPERISARVRRQLDSATIYLGVISWWEVILKSSKGKPEVGDPRAWWAEAIEKLGEISLSLRPEHLSELPKLEALHSDPFHRALLAQAIAERLPLVTTDHTLARYSTPGLQVVSCAIEQA